jgi:hypothetical protein
VHAGSSRPSSSIASNHNNSSSNLARSSSAASLPLAVALGKDTLGVANLSPTNSSSHNNSTALVLAGSSSASVVQARPSSALSSLGVGGHGGEVIPVPSSLVPGQRIDVPLIRWAHVAPEAAHTRNQALKAEFHAQVKSFFKNAKQNIDELASELFYEDEDDEEEDQDEAEEAEANEDADGGSATADGSTPVRAKKKPSSKPSAAATGHVFGGADAENLGSPHKKQLLQQLLSLSKHMDEGLTTFTSAAREAATKAAKENKQHAAAASTGKHRLNQQEMAQLAAMTRELLEGNSSSNGATTISAVSLPSSTPRKTGKDSADGAPPPLSEETKASLAAFVRRQQLPERHRAYEQWVASKASAQAKALAKAEREAKQARLAELQAARLRAAQEKAAAEEESAARERERAARAEEEALRRELEAQARAEAAEEAARLREEEAERARLERERRAREAARRAEREAEAARLKLEEDMARRAAEQRAWEEEKRQRELQENEALRLTEELKRDVARDVARATQQAAALGSSSESQGNDAADEAREHAELDALFAAADAAGAPNDGPDTDEEFAEFGEDNDEEVGGGGGASRRHSRAPYHASASARHGAFSAANFLSAQCHRWSQGAHRGPFRCRVEFAAELPLGAVAAFLSTLAGLPRCQRWLFDRAPHRRFDGPGRRARHAVRLCQCVHRRAVDELSLRTCKAHAWTMKKNTGIIGFSIAFRSLFCSCHMSACSSHFFVSLLLLALRAAWACHNFQRTTDEDALQTQEMQWEKLEQTENKNKRTHRRSARLPDAICFGRLLSHALVALGDFLGLAAHGLQLLRVAGRHAAAGSVRR